MATAVQPRWDSKIMTRRTPTRWAIQRTGHLAGAASGAGEVGVHTGGTHTGGGLVGSVGCGRLQRPARLLHCSVLHRRLRAEPPAIRLALSELDRIQLPLVRHALEPVPATVDEHEAGPGDQVLDRPRAQKLPGPGPGEHAGRDVHRDPADVVAQPLAF